MATLTCPTCRTPFQQGDLICLTCGANLARVRNPTREEPPRQASPQAPQQPHVPAQPERQGQQPQFPARPEWQGQEPQFPQQPQFPSQPERQGQQPQFPPPQPPAQPQGTPPDQYAQAGPDGFQQPGYEPPGPAQQNPYGRRPGYEQPPPYDAQYQQGPGPSALPPVPQQVPYEPGRPPYGATPPYDPRYGPQEPPPRVGPPQPPRPAREETLMRPEVGPSHQPQPQVIDSTAAMCPYCEAVLASPAAAQCDSCLRPLPRHQMPQHEPPAPAAPAPPVLRLRFPTGELQLQPGQHLVLGRDAGQSSVAGVFTQYDNVSRRHTTVWLDQSGVAWVRDERSTNGTFVNGERLPPGVEAPLRDGDSLRLAADVTGTINLG